MNPLSLKTHSYYRIKPPCSQRLILEERRLRISSGTNGTAARGERQSAPMARKPKESRNLRSCFLSHRATASVRNGARGIRAGSPAVFYLLLHNHCASSIMI